MAQRERNTGAAEGRRPGIRRKAAIIFLACFSGWFVMQLEMLGARILTPYFGSAVYVVMGSVIGVFLLSLSVGYILGGRLSKTTHSRRTLGMNLAGAGAWLILLPFLVEPVCDRVIAMGFDDKWGSLLASAILFTVPIALLGTVSPAAVRWLTQEAGESGLNAGLVLAFSTAASFAGCIVTAFYLVLLSVRRTLWVSGALLLAMGAGIVAHAFICRKRDKRGEKPV